MTIMLIDVPVVTPNCDIGKFRKIYLIYMKISFCLKLQLYQN